MHLHIFLALENHLRHKKSCLIKQLNPTKAQEHSSSWAFLLFAFPSRTALVAVLFLPLSPLRGALPRGEPSVTNHLASPQGRGGARSVTERGLFPLFHPLFFLFSSPIPLYKFSHPCYNIADVSFISHQKGSIPCQEHILLLPLRPRARKCSRAATATERMSAQTSPAVRPTSRRRTGG